MLQRYGKYQCETILSPVYFHKVSNVKKYTKRTVPFCVLLCNSAPEIAWQGAENRVEKQRKSLRKVQEIT
jgi:hypothetical protein